VSCRPIRVRARLVWSRVEIKAGDHEWTFKSQPVCAPVDDEERSQRKCAGGTSYVVKGRVQITYELKPDELVEWAVRRDANTPAELDPFCNRCFTDVLDRLPSKRYSISFEPRYCSYIDIRYAMVLHLTMVQLPTSTDEASLYATGHTMSTAFGPATDTK
jgi:hypothetical protein